VNKSPIQQRGFSLVSAIFLLVVLAGLGAAMVTFSNAQSRNLALDVLGSRAYQAAQAGIEWAAYNIALNPSAQMPAHTLTPLGGDLADFTVTVAYSATSSVASTDEGGDVGGGQVWSYDITSSAVAGTPGNAGYIERVVSAKK
jgi:MSHA biogenesis protein MshP